jgi:hypothetical protein
MKPKMQYKLVPKGTNEFLELVDFAEEFDHKIIEHPNINVYAHYSNGNLFGYSDHVYLPTVYPAFHPKHTRPQDVIQVMRDWVTYCQITNSPSYIGVPLKDERINFTNEIMEKLGLTPTKREIYSITT